MLELEDPTAMEEGGGDRASGHDDETQQRESDDEGAQRKANESTRPSRPSTKSYPFAVMLAGRDRKALEDMRRIEEGDHAGGTQSSQFGSTDGGWAPSRFQAQFADLVRDSTGTDVFRSTIIGALVEMKVHHEAMTGINEMTAAMETVEGARAVFGIGPTRVLQAIMNIVHSIQTCRRE